MSKEQGHLKCRVQSSDGPVCGYIEKVDDKTYYRFKKIPYAKPPLGSLRFRPPVPVNPWDEELHCTEEDASPPLCFFFENQIIGSEDCLYIEVCSPNISPKEPLPVMFWIGNFSFIFCMDPILDPRLIVDREVVFVKCGYRLGPFGFLSINECIAPGNNGMKDIVMALQWVQRNIRAFGGDPNNVTLFGISSGGSIVHYMMLSPMATGLFHKGIIQSASAINIWALEKNPLQPVMNLAAELNITTTDFVEIVKELKKLPCKDIMEATLRLLLRIKYGERDAVDTIFKPCIEKEFEGIPVFLSKGPAAILKSGIVNKVPIVIGANNSEASFLEYFDDKFFDNVKKKLELAQFMPKALATQKMSKNIGQKVMNFYLDGNETLGQDTKQEIIQLMTDYYFLYDVNKTIRIHKENAPECPVYYYIINYAGEWMVPKVLEFFNRSAHAADIPFLFQVTFPDGTICKGSRDSMITRCRVIKMWTNFAKYGNPTPDENDSLLKITWDPVASKDELNFLSIGQDLTKGVNPFQDRMLFWEELHKEYTFSRALKHLNDLGVLF